ncbi:MAG: 4Fe-4S binding protein [Chloroflexi bacterium]|nr:4Fe-4S binding protein [Chloroflexota bacterium]
MVSRQIVKINEDLCNGCGLCVTPCVEGAIAIVNGKARVMNEELCDGAGFCLAVCPTGALTIEERQTVPFNKATAEEQQRFRSPTYIAQSCFRCGSTEEQAVLLPCRRHGESLWVCTRCLPYLIHG